MAHSTRSTLPTLTLIILSLFALSATAQSATSASIYPAPTGWTYTGCYNETTLANGTNGLRALNGGVNEDLNTMTVPLCLSFCQMNSYAFAGLEYTRQCFCAAYLSALSSKLPATSCDLPCIGNNTQICGGSLALSVYQTKTSTKGAAVQIGSQAPMGSILALGIAVAVLLCIA